MTMRSVFNFHDLLQICIIGSKSSFREYCEFEFDHGKQNDSNEFLQNIPTLHVYLDTKLHTDGTIWALGKGLFYNEDSQELLISSDRNTSFFDQKNIYATMTNITDTSTKDLVIRIIPNAIPSKTKHPFLEEFYRRFIQMDPRDRNRRNAEGFVSQFLEPNIYRLFLKSNHLLIHAAALEKTEHGLLIFGSQNIGKTSVTIALSRCGWNMLGDDFCLLNENAELKSYGKPLKLESEFIKKSKEIYNVALKEKNKYDSAMKSLLSRFSRKAGAFEIKVPASAFGISTIKCSKLKTAVFLQRCSKTVTKNKIEITKISTEEALILCKQHIAAEFDGNKILDRDIRQNLSLHFRLANQLSSVTSDALNIINKAFKNINSYIITMNCSDADASDAIDQLLNKTEND